MDFLKRNMFYLVSTLVAAGGIGLMFTGVQAMPSVVEEMKKVEGVYRELSGLQGRPANKRQIDAVQVRIDRIKADYERVLSQAEELGGYTLLVPGVLPAGDALLQGEFRKKYNDEMQVLFDSLKGGGVASALDFARARELVEREDAEERLRDPSLDLEAIRRTGPVATRAGVLTPAGAHHDHLPRAHISAAQQILMYVTHWLAERPTIQVSSLDFHSEMLEEGAVDVPDAFDTWHAQIGFWIQQDVVAAIGAINLEASEALRKSGEHSWVGNMPVKELISIRLSSGLVPESGEIVVGPRAGNYDASLPPGTPETVFTGSGSGALFDTVQFSLKLIMDQRDIPGLVDRLSKNSPHTLLRISYEAVPENRRMLGKIYGSEPAVNVILDFETIFLGRVYRRLIPPSVVEYYQVQCRAIDECYDDEES